MYVQTYWSMGEKAYMRILHLKWQVAAHRLDYQLSARLSVLGILGHTQNVEFFAGPQPKVVHVKQISCCEWDYKKCLQCSPRCVNKIPRIQSHQKLILVKENMRQIFKWGRVHRFLQKSLQESKWISIIYDKILALDRGGGGENFEQNPNPFSRRFSLVELREST